MMFKSMSINTDNRRSSVASSCPSSVASSFSSATECSDSFATPASSWSGTYIDSNTDFSLCMKDLTEGAFTADQEFYTDFSMDEAMQLDLTPNTLPFRTVNASYNFDTRFDGIIPSHTMNSTASSPSTLDGSRDFTTFDGIDIKISYLEEPSFIAMSPSLYKKQGDASVKLEAKYASCAGSIKKEKLKRPKHKPFPATVARGKFQCGYPGCQTTKKFVRLEHLKRHEKTHDETGKYNVPCRFCVKPFSRADNLRDHEERHANPGGDSGGTKSSKRVKFIEGARAILDAEKALRKKRVGLSKPKNVRSKT